MKRLHYSSDPVLIRACSRKAKYVSEAKARDVAQAQCRRPDDPMPRLWVYACAHCRSWHLTKTPSDLRPVTATERFEGLAI